MHKVTPAQVHSVLKKHVLVDGMSLVLDFEKSHGLYLYDSLTKKKYLDFFSFFASNPIGFNHPKMINDDNFRNVLLRASFHKPTNSDVYTVEYADYMDILDKYAIPSYLPYTLFIEGGALAVENALKTAFDWKYQKNKRLGYKFRDTKIIHFRYAFHGRSGYTLSLTNTDPTKTDRFPKFNWPRVSSPAIDHSIENYEKKVIEAEKIALNEVKRAFEENPNEIAAVIIEPIQCEGGDRLFRYEFHKSLYDLTHQNDALFIYDEVQTGVGITGKFWAHEHYIKPDILCFGKKTQVCGIMCGRKIEENPHHVFNTSSRLNSTWGGNLVDMVRFGKVLNIIAEDNLVNNAKEVGAYLISKLNDLSSQYDIMTNQRGLGLMCAFDLPNSQVRDNIIRTCYEKQLLLLPCGTRSIRFRPSLNVEKKHVDELCNILNDVLKAIK